MRKQIPMPIWLIEYFDKAVEKCDETFGNITLVFICLGILNMVSHFHPKYRSIPRFLKRFYPLCDKAAIDEIQIAEMQRAISDLLYETRKAIEYRQNHATSNK